jgi:hypothetical protein
MNHRHDLARLSTINQNSSLTRANTCDYDRMLWVDCAWSRQRTRITRVSLPANPCGRDLAAFDLPPLLRPIADLVLGEMVKYPRRDIPLGPNNQDRH